MRQDLARVAAAELENPGSCAHGCGAVVLESSLSDVIGLGAVSRYLRFISRHEQQDYENIQKMVGISQIGQWISPLKVTDAGQSSFDAERTS